LRALAALFVFAYHVQLFGLVAPGRAPMNIGYVGVSFFFILSGFVLTWSADPVVGARAFYWRRFARIYPAYAFLLVVTGLAGSPAAPRVTGRGVALSATLLQAWSPHDGTIVHAVNPPSWSLSDEAFFYALLPLALLLFRRVRPSVAIVLTLGWFLATSAVVVYGSHAGSSWEYIDFTFPVVRSGEFFLGVMAALELRRGRRLPLVPAVATAAACIPVLVVAPAWSPLPDIILDPLFLVAIVWAAQADIVGRTGLLTHRTAVYAGGISYAFYLVHQFVIAELALHVGRGAGVALLGLVIATAGAVVVHHGVERPCRRFLMASFGKAGAGRPSYS
jgi:peptidoglycan/LPS O-acetylase OafA/YrhL